VSVSNDDEFSNGNWTEPQSKSFEEIYGDLGGAQRELSDFTYPDPDKMPEPYVSKVPALIRRYIEYLDSRLASGQNFQQALGETPLPDHAFDDQIQRVRSRTLDFETAMRVWLFIQATGMSHREFADNSERSWFREMLGMEHAISHPTPGNAKRNRFDFELRRFLSQFGDEVVRTGHEYETHWRYITHHPDWEADGGGETRIDQDVIKDHASKRACELVFPYWKCGRSDFEHLCQLLYMGMVDASADKGPRRYQRNTGEGTASSRFRDIIKRYSEEDILEAFHQSVGSTISELQDANEDLFPNDLRLALDETVSDYYGEPDPNERMAEVVHGMPKSHPSPFALKYGTVTTTREQSLPIILGLYRLTAKSDWGGETTHKHEIVEGLLDQAERYGNPEFLVADRAFDGYQVLAETINRDVEILTPLRKNKYQKYHCTYMAHKDIDVDVPTYILERTADEKDWDFEPSVVKELYLPSTRENTRTAVFRTTNPWVAEDTAEEFVKQYSYRWQIESQYQVVRQEFWPDIRTHRYATRLFYFAFGCVMQNAWRVADYWTQMEMYGRFDPDERELRAGEFVDFASSYTED